MSTSIVTNSSISSITGYKVAATARLGSNGDESGDNDYYVSAAGGSPITLGHKQWSADPVDSIDCANIETALTAPPGGGTNAVTWSVAGGATDPLTLTTSYGAISSLKVRALVKMPNCSFSWTSVVAKFYKNGSLVETINYSPVVATTEEDEASEQILTITPTNNDNTSVVVTAKVNFSYPSVDIESSDAVAGQVYIFAA